MRFWAAELSSALEYLHKQRIIHRYAVMLQPHSEHPLIIPRSDLKPDNILLDAMGHAHITDFNVAIHYSERRLHTSVAGSMAYMAPEVIGRQGYSWQCDWWSLGVVLWELLFHRRPFDGRSAEKMKHSILKDSIRIPSHMKDKCSKEGQQFLLGVSQP